MDESIWQGMRDIVEYMQKEFNIVALILCGSRHVGDYKSTSDWDIKAFCEKTPDHPPELQGYELDCTFHEPNTTFSVEEFGIKLRQAEIIFDNKNKDGQRILEEAEILYEKGPKPWTKKYILSRRDKVRRYEQRFEKYIHQNRWFELHQRLNWHFLENSYSWWYGIRNEWEPRPQLILEDLSERDPDFYYILVKIADPRATDIERVGLFRRLHDLFFESETYIEAESRDS